MPQGTEGERRQRGKWTTDSYEAKLAHYAVQDDWSDQEITNLIIAFRRKHGERVELSEKGEPRSVVFRD